jgi:hypothetical protein
MAEANSVSCDICKVTKREVNRWWKVRQMKHTIAVAPAEVVVPKPFKDVCGQSCLHRLVDRWMETGSLEKPEVEQKGGNDGLV